MKAATLNENHLEEDKTDLYKSKEQTSKAHRDNIHETKKS